ncbi:MAG: hypothetical protein ACRECZ_05630, partial [Methylocella sp.]
TLERFLITWNCVIDKEPLGNKELEHAGIEKAEQLFYGHAPACGGDLSFGAGVIPAASLPAPLRRGNLPKGCGDGIEMQMEWRRAR